MRPRKGQEKHATRRVGVRLPADVRGLLDHMAATEDRTISDVMIAAVRLYAKTRHRLDGATVEQARPRDKEERR